MTIEPRAFDVTLIFPLAFCVALLLVIPAIRILRTLAGRIGMVDAPDGGRHAHGAPVPNVGGIAIFFAFGITLALVLAAAHAIPSQQVDMSAMLPILGGAAAMHLLGLLDDRRKLGVRVKLVAQSAIAVAVFAGGLRITAMTLPLFGPVAFGTWVSLILTVAWLVGLTNAFNLIDGADGVAGGAALTAAAAMFVVALVLGQPLIALGLAIVGGAVLGFLFFNFPPATVFLGNSGSLFVGFLLASLGLAGSSKATTMLAIAIPVVSLGLPVLDTVLAIVRRLIRGDRITQGDLGHIHHRLLELADSPRRVALILYAACSVFALASLMLLHPDRRMVGGAFVVVGVAVLVGVQRLKLPELVQLGRLIAEGAARRAAATQEAVAQIAAVPSGEPKGEARSP